MRNKKSGDKYGSNAKCTLCDASIEQVFLPMKEWGMDGRYAVNAIQKNLQSFILASMKE